MAVGAKCTRFVDDVDVIVRSRFHREAIVVEDDDDDDDDDVDDNDISDLECVDDMEEDSSYM